MVLFEKVMSVFKHSGEVFLYVIGAPEENELILASVLSCLEESLKTLFNTEAKCVGDECISYELFFPFT